MRISKPASPADSGGSCTRQGVVRRLQQRSEIPMRALSSHEYDLIAAIHKANRARPAVCVTQAGEFAAGDPLFDGARFLRACGHPAEVGAYAANQLAKHALQQEVA